MHVFTLRIPDELADDIKLCASIDGESVNKWLQLTVKDAVAKKRELAGAKWSGSPAKQDGQSARQ